MKIVQKWYDRLVTSKVLFVIVSKLMKRIPTPGIEPGPRRWERRILTTRPRGSYILDLNRLYFNNRSPADIWLKKGPALHVLSWKNLFCMIVVCVQPLSIYVRSVFAKDIQVVKRLSSLEPCIAPNFISSEFRVLLNNACHIVCKAACCLGKGSINTEILWWHVVSFFGQDYGWTLVSSFHEPEPFLRPLFLVFMELFDFISDLLNEK